MTNMNGTKKQDSKYYYPYIKMYALFAVSAIYLEIAFHILIYGSIGVGILLASFKAITTAGVFSVICSFGDKKTKKVLSYICISILVLLYCIHIVYYDIFKTFLSLYSLTTGTTQVMEFWREIFSAILTNSPKILTLILPIPVFYLTVNKMLLRKDSEKQSSFHTSWVMKGIVLAFVGAVHFTFLVTLSFMGKTVYSAYDLYYYTSASELSVKKLGLFTTMEIDMKRLVFGIKTNEDDNSEGVVLEPVEETVTPMDQIEGEKTNESEVKIDIAPNVWNIDFKTLIAQERSETVKQMHEYFSMVSPTYQNEYTGMFKNYNLIQLTAEGFSPYAVDKNVTPTLYKLTHEGFVFRNFYTPIWGVSTSDGEYVACTSLIPKTGVWSFYQSGSNAMPFTLGNVLKRSGIESRAYHNHSYTYYKRNISHPNIGYDFKAVGHGLEVTETWPESDLEMMEVTIPEYINDTPFHTYYMTISGHMNYNFSGNYIASKNRSIVENLPYTSEAKAYIACNVELDRALEKLILSLEEAGIADQTVIALSADHYPYGLKKSSIDELAGHEVEENFELYKNHFILWSAGMEKNIVITKPCSSLDILPTLLNLFGMDYDSRLLMGRDILSDTDPLVIFNNHSYITDKVMLNTMNGKVTELSEGVTKEYIEKINEIVNKKFIYSAQILENDYYQYFLDSVDE